MLLSFAASSACGAHNGDATRRGVRGSSVWPCHRAPSLKARGTKYGVHVLLCSIGEKKCAAMADIQAGTGRVSWRLALARAGGMALLARFAHLGRKASVRLCHLAHQSAGAVEIVTMAGRRGTCGDE